MSCPHNRRARALRERERIKSVWLDLVQREPFERHTAKDIARRLNFPLTADTVRWHMRHIRTEELIRATGMSEVTLTPHDRP